MLAGSVIKLLLDKNLRTRAPQTHPALAFPPLVSLALIVHSQRGHIIELVEYGVWQRRQLVGIQVPASPKCTLEFRLSKPFYPSPCSSGTLTAHRAKQADRRCRLTATSTR